MRTASFGVNRASRAWRAARLAALAGALAACAEEETIVPPDFVPPVIDAGPKGDGTIAEGDRATDHDLMLTSFRYS